MFLARPVGGWGMGSYALLSGNFGAPSLSVVMAVPTSRRVSRASSNLPAEREARAKLSGSLTLHASFDRGYAAPTVARSGGRVMTHGRGAAA